MKIEYVTSEIWTSTHSTIDKLLEATKFSKKQKSDMGKIANFKCMIMEANKNLK